MYRTYSHKSLFPSYPQRFSNGIIRPRPSTPFFNHFLVDIFQGWIQGQDTINLQYTF